MIPIDLFIIKGNIIVFLENQEEHSTHFVFPELRDGSHVDVYVDNNLIEVYINDGEYVITNVVYDLKEK